MTRALVALEDWPDEVIPLTPEPIAPMSILGVPEVVAEHVEAVAEGLQVPRDLALLSDLGALATCAQGLAWIDLGHGWSEELSLFTMTVLPSAERKSATMLEATRPIEDYEGEWIARTRAKVRQERQAYAALVTREDQATKRLANAQTIEDRATAEHELAEITAEVAAARPASPPRLLADDVTPEQLARLLAENGRIGIVSAEGGIIDTLAGRYSKGVANLDAALKAYGGETIRVDRRSGDPVHVIRPLLTLSLSVQPDVMETAAANPALMGRGLMPRFLLSAPASRAGHREVEPAPIPETVRTRWAVCLHGLLEYGEQDGYAPFAPMRLSPAIGLDQAARHLHVAFRQEVETGLHPDDGEWSGVGAFAGKAPGLAGRIAGLLHLAEHGPRGITRKVSKETMFAAIEIVRTHLAHAGRLVHGGAESEEVRDARTIIRWARSTGRDTFTGREALTGARKRAGGPDTADRVRQAVLVLQERGWLREYDPAGSPATSSTRWEINPGAVR